MPSVGTVLLNKGLGIYPDKSILGTPLPDRSDRVTRGESVFSTNTAIEAYVEEDPTTGQWIREHIPNLQGVQQFAIDLFPFTRWIRYYNLTWLTGDLIAGITVGSVVVPQGMAYAKLANLPVQYGLYSSFCGAAFYFLFATSKDITIGPVAVLSTLTGNIITAVLKVHPDVTAEEVASALALIIGCFVFVIGILRLGFIVDFIPLVSIAAYMTGSALNIGIGQIPTVFGINKLLNTRAPTYWVIINTLKNLHHSTLDTALGLTALVLLYLIRYVCNYASKKQPNRKRLWFFISTLRTVFVMLLYTLISWLMVRHHKKSPRIAVLGTVPRGFKAAGAPHLNHKILAAIAPHLPVAVIVTLIEHIAISKSFGRVNNYRINPSQELVAIGFSNIFGPFLGAYPATGSFSRTAIKSKAGVRTPLAGVITAIVVLLATYALPPLFYYIPSSPLSAVIIHAVFDLITPPRVVYQFWRVNPLEVVIFFAGVLVTVFSSIENGIYVTITTSAGLMLWRIAKPSGDFLGRIKVRTVDGNEQRNIFRPLKPWSEHTSTNPLVPVQAPYPGVFVFRFNSDFIYPNVNHYIDIIVEHVLDNTKATTRNHYGKPGDRPWNDPAERASDFDEHLPTLKAVIFDLAAVANVDVTSVQLFVDIRQQFARHTQPDPIPFYFASIRNPWTRRALASAGFGYASGDVRAVFSVAQGGDEVRDEKASAADAEAQETPVGQDADVEGKGIPLHSLDRPYFTTDVDEALHSVIVNLGIKTGEGSDEGVVASKQD